MHTPNVWARNRVHSAVSPAVSPLQMCDWFSIAASIECVVDRDFNPCDWTGGYELLTRTGGYELLTQRVSSLHWFSIAWGTTCFFFPRVFSAGCCVFSQSRTISPQSRPGSTQILNNAFWLASHTNTVLWCTALIGVKYAFWLVSAHQSEAAVS